MANIAIWSDILQELKQKFDTTTYDAWFKTLQPVNEDDHTIYLMTTSFNARIINNKNYRDDFQRIYRQLTGENKSFVVLSENDLKGEVLESKKETGIVKGVECNLNPAYIFKNFVVGKNNQLAYAASVAVAQSPGNKEHNPLFIYGGVGLGKTHLMHAIGNEVKSVNPNANIIYVSSETFTNDFIHSIMQQTSEAFRQKYRSADVLLVDDIQFLEDKEQTQEAFFHTFNDLQLANKHIVISSDRLPQELKTLDDRLRSRFSQGLYVDISPPDFETRIAILKKKAKDADNRISSEVYDYIAKNIKSNIRELEGALTRIIAYASLVGKSIDLPLCQEALKGIINTTKKEIDYHLIRKIICEHFNVTEKDLDSSKRTKSLAYPRQIAMYLIRDFTDLSLPKIGEIFGNRDHSTVVYAYDKVTNDIVDDPSIKALIEELKKKITLQ